MEDSEDLITAKLSMSYVFRRIRDGLIASQSILSRADEHIANLISCHVPCKKLAIALRNDHHVTILLPVWGR